MLMLSRLVGQSVMISHNIRVSVTEIVFKQNEDGEDRSFVKRQLEWPVGVN